MFENSEYFNDFPILNIEDVSTYNFQEHQSNFNEANVDDNATFVDFNEESTHVLYGDSFTMSNRSSILLHSGRSSFSARSTKKTSDNGNKIQDARNRMNAFDSLMEFTVIPEETP